VARYPAGWDGEGRLRHGLASCEWSTARGRRAVRQRRERPRGLPRPRRRTRAPRFAAHWEFVLAAARQPPLGQDGVAALPPDRVLPHAMMAYLAVDDPGALARSDFVRLGWPSARRGAGRCAGSLCRGASGRFRTALRYVPVLVRLRRRADTRLSVLGLCAHRRRRREERVYSCRDRGCWRVPAPAFLLFLIAALQKATLLMVSEQLAKR